MRSRFPSRQKSDGSQAGARALLCGRFLLIGSVSQCAGSVDQTCHVVRLFVQADEDSAHRTWRHVAYQIRQHFPKAAQLMDEAEHDVLAYFAYPVAHRSKLHSTNTLERLNKEVKRRANVVGIFPNEASILRLIGAVLMEQNEEWQLQHRYMPQHTMTDVPGEPPQEAVTVLPITA